METIDTDPRVNIVFYKDDCNSIDLAYTAAQEAYTVDQDIKLIMCFSAAQAVGANNYVISMPGINIEEYGIFCTVDDNATKELVAMSSQKYSNSAVRGILVTGTEGSNIWDGEFRILKALLIEGVEEFPYVSLDPFYCYNSVGYEFEFVQE